MSHANMTPEQLKRYQELVAQLPDPTKDIENFIKMPEGVGIINASTKPGYDPLNCLAGYFPPNPRIL
jgi:hypothetical protein